MKARNHSVNVVSVNFIGRKFLDGYKEKNVCIIGMNIDVNVFADLVEIAKHVTVIEHEKRTEWLYEVISDKEKLTHIYNHDKSIAQTVWDIYHKNTKVSPGVPKRPRSKSQTQSVQTSKDLSKLTRKLSLDNLHEKPWFIDYFADVSLYREQINDSKDVVRGFVGLGYLRYDKLDKISKNPPEVYKSRCRHAGKLLSKKEDKAINNLLQRVEGPYIFNLGNERITYYVSDCSNEYRSKLLNTVCIQHKDCHFAMKHEYSFREKEWTIYLKSVGDKFDVMSIARLYNGSGQFNSAKFTIKDYHCSLHYVFNH